MKAIKSFFVGLGIGVAVAVGIYLLAQVLDLIGCFFTCGSMACFSQKSCVGKMGLYNGSIATKIFAFCTIAGTVIGAVYGIAKQVQEASAERERKEKEANDERERKEKEASAKYLKQTEEYAADFKQKVNLAISQCEKNRNISENFSLQPDPDYKCVSLQGDLWKALHEVSIPLQELTDIVKEFSTVKEEK